MKIQHQITALTLAITLAASTVFGQDCCCQENEAYSPAYSESSYTSHWSVYIPITILAGAAIWFGVSDTKGSKDDSYGFQDGLGSIANSKRLGRSGSGSHRSSHQSNISKYSKSSYRAKGIYSH